MLSGAPVINFWHKLRPCRQLPTLNFRLATMFYAFLEIEKTYIEICDKKCQNTISKKKTTCVMWNILVYLKL